MVFNDKNKWQKNDIANIVSDKIMIISDDISHHNTVKVLKNSFVAKSISDRFYKY